MAVGGTGIVEEPVDSLGQTSQTQGHQVTQLKPNNEEQWHEIDDWYNFQLRVISKTELKGYVLHDIGRSAHDPKWTDFEFTANIIPFGAH